MSVFARIINPNINTLKQVLKPTKTKLVLGYLTGSVLGGGYLSYKDGLKELEYFREWIKRDEPGYYINNKLITNNSSEIRVARTAFYQHLWYNVKYCAKMPVDFAAFLIPYYIYGLNKKDACDNGIDE